MSKIIKKSLLIGLALATSISISVFANTLEVSSNDIVKQGDNLVLEEYIKSNAGWVLDVDGKWYYYEGGQVKKGWLKDGANWYYLSKEDGSMVKDRVDYINSEFYCFDKSGVMQANKWYYNYGAWYWLKDSGAAYKGWLKQGNYWYYLDKTNAFMLEGAQNIDGTLYFLTGSGALTQQKGWIKMYDTYYYANSDGSLRTGWVEDNGQWYYLNKNGQMATGWVKDGGYWYYLDPSDGHMYTDMVKVDFNLYFFNSSGQMLSSRWHQYYGDWYYLTSSGAPHKGWLNQGGKWYYLDPSYGIMSSGGNEIDGKVYVFDESGAMITKNGWNKVYNHWYYIKSNGDVYTGWFKEVSSWYYLDPKYGYMFVGGQPIDGKAYLFTKSGAMSIEEGWIYQDGLYYYGNGDGTVKIGWLKYNDKWCFLDTYAGWMVTGRAIIDEDYYYFDDNGYMYSGWKVFYDYQLEEYYTCYYGDDGALKTGWQVINGKTYYFLDYGNETIRIGTMVTGKYVIDGVEYYFDDDGVLQL